MKDKKLVIVLIVLVIILLIGGAYLLGRGNNKESEKLVNIGENNEQQAKNNISDCLPTTDPSIKVLSPNGGETYVMGQETVIKWSSCNLPSSMHVRAYLERQAPLPDYEWQSPILFGNINEGQIASSLNDGEQLVILDSVHDVIPASYKLCITEYLTSPGQNIIQDCSDNSLIINSSSEESVSEVFSNQLGEIKTIQKNGVNKWLLSVDLLTLNPNFSPGSTDFYINQNSKIRDLNVTNMTKTFKCGMDSIPNVLQPTEDFIKGIQTGEYKNRYFDISGNNITTIYEQCLP